MSRMAWTVMALALPLVFAGQARAGFVATYLFNNTLSAQEAGAPALTAVDPLGANTFATDTVFGNSRRVYAFTGNGSPPSQQAGLSFNNSGSNLPNNNYSAEMVFEFLNPAGWRRILDVQNRQSDNGFYVDPGNHLDVFPVGAGATPFTSNTYHHVVLSESSSGTLKAYLDGALQFSVSSTVMNINNPSNLVNFFLDNTVGGGQGEYSSGRVALIRLYDRVLSDSEVSTLAADPFPTQAVPEPASLALMGIGTLGLVGFARLRRRAVNAQ